MLPLTSFPHTLYLFDAGGTAVSNDDLVISGDSSLFREFGNGVTDVISSKKKSTGPTWAFLCQQMET